MLHSYRQLGSWLLLLSYSLGLVLASYEHHLPTTFMLIPVLLWAMAPFQRHGQGLSRTSATIICMLFLGQFCYHQAWSVTQAEIPSGKQQITATVIRLESQPQRWRMDVTVEKPEILSGQRVRVHLLDSHCPLLPGDTLSWTGKLRRPRRFGTPGEFDYPRYLANLGISASGYITSSKQIEVKHPTTIPSPLVAVERWRSQLGQAIATKINHPQTPFLISLVLGEKSRLTPAQRQDLAQFGLSHLFAISGLHLGLLASMLYLVVQKLYRRSTRALMWCPLQQAVAVLILPPLLFYLLLSGGALPTWRAGLLIALAAWLTVRHRHVRPDDLLYSIALLILLVKPLALFGASFQLSFAGVAALILVLPTWRHWQQHRWQRWLALPPLVTLTATVATLPIALWHFHVLAPAALVNNLYAVPLVGLVILPVTLLATALLATGLPGAPLLFHTAGDLLNGILSVATTISQGFLAAQRLYLTVPHHLVLAGISITLLALLAKHRRLTVASLTTTLLGGAILGVTSMPPSTLQLSALSVGQGDCLLLQRANGTTCLIDGGGLYSQTFDVGERLVAPALGRLGVDQIDTVILTHDHPDHRKGLIHILKHFPVKSFWCSTTPELLHDSLQYVLGTHDIPVRVFSAGWTDVEHTADQQLSVFVAPQPHNKNDQSLVVYVRNHHQGILLCGDLEHHGVEQLLADPPPGPVNVIKLPHHGSRHSAHESLLHDLQPAWAIATVGYRNRYHFPHSAVIDTLATMPTTLIRTDRDGSVRLIQSIDGWQQHNLATKLPWP
ncbi:DNA internalization-related competence protein ComEC/Rec2 [Desulfuromonas acetoxidans]|uniref:DNA internalization-related competence protein ComEC/Rec2 n=1 Tax=Desulfuromonas acetoxidans TaxID=891 RepID=UPI002931CD9C|nr:DNA internalization-related competence protein ComEC/Rec2 [Desulfuromonas acetoxidans]